MQKLPNETAKNVSRETFSILEHYVSLLLEWNRNINLVADSTLENIWQRHILDSLQLMHYLPSMPCQIVDFGSGGGLPAMILAIATPHHYIMMESDKRKISFLRYCLVELKLTNVQLMPERIEKALPVKADIGISRACASLDKLMQFAQRHVVKNGKLYFLKGKSVREEIAFASGWALNYTLHPSVSDSAGSVLEIMDWEKQHD